MGSTLTIIISDLFLRDKNDFPFWTKTVFDEYRTVSFNTKIVWLSRIMKHHIDFKNKDIMYLINYLLVLEHLKKNRNFN